MNQERKVNKIDEIWKDVKGYEGLYKISNRGKVYSFYTNKILKNSKSIDGYYRVYLRKNKKRKFASIHRLVAEAFIPNPNDLPQVNHKDENKKNNNVYNLEWCDCKYNANYGTRNKRGSNSKKKAIEQYTKDNKLIRIWNSSIEIRDVLGFDTSAISKCCNNRKNFNSSHGYIWKFK